MQAQDPTTIGLSPKAVAASLTAAAATVLVGLAFKLVGIELDVGIVGAIIGPLILAGVTFVAARLARVGVVHIEGPPARELEVDAAGTVTAERPAGDVRIDDPRPPDPTSP